MMRLQMSLFIMLAACTVSVQAQQAAAPPAPCMTAAHHQMDFWVGNWTVNWTGSDGKRATGQNKISRLWNGCAIQEKFDGAPGSTLQGRSLSSFDPATGKWRQMWADSQGSSFMLWGGPQTDGNFILATQAYGEGQLLQSRMLFNDISKDALSWDWQATTDGGKTWASQWKLAYTRQRIAKAK